MKIFDSIIAEPGKSTRMDLSSVMNECEALCLSHRWDVQLAEMPLYGCNSEPMAAMVEAREAIFSLEFDANNGTGNLT